MVVGHDRLHPAGPGLSRPTVRYARRRGRPAACGGRSRTGRWIGSWWSPPTSTTPPWGPPTSSAPIPAPRWSPSWAAGPPAYPDPVSASGTPPGGSRPATTWWPSGGEEDRAAMASMGARPVWLEFADHQYLAPERPAPAVRRGAGARAGRRGSRPHRRLPAHGPGQPRPRAHPRRRAAGAGGPGRRRARPGLVRLRGRRLQAPPRACWRGGCPGCSAAGLWPTPSVVPVVPDMEAKRKAIALLRQPAGAPGAASTSSASGWPPTCPSSSGASTRPRRGGRPYPPAMTSMPDARPEPTAVGPGTTALVTGASSGIGAATARAAGRPGGDGGAGGPPGRPARGGGRRVPGRRAGTPGPSPPTWPTPTTPPPWPSGCGTSSGPSTWWSTTPASPCGARPTG